MGKILLCYPGGRHKALTMSYDDGQGADRRLVDIFNRYGIRGTFHLNSGLLGESDRVTAEEVRALYAGHEVSAHTLTHPTIARCPNEQIVHEVMEDRRRLEQLVGYTVRGMSYPNGSHSRRIRELLPGLGIEYARVVPSSGQFGLPDDWLQWQPTCHHNHNLMPLAETFAGLHKTQYLYLMYVWGHSYEFDNDNNWELMEEFCSSIGGRDDIWYATNIEIVDYVKAYEQLKFSASLAFVHNPTATNIWLSVDGRIIEVRGGEQVQLNISEALNRLE
ncbi:polysaccharide deacetylase family protein [Cohnella lubricantis]|uniref:Polysaccharide deacetylase family protein n=1 Tax=Cohnella lubricantis TaxID=2163172 RepID=A0A841TIZ9_9BACL|nr:polysaccharide deacetylase family protein [Cohnella lubricantis]MBB6678471.1 polysaccharide deacetylase family protein [Cohnella lubricantis]MBP2118394.1 peptidoglycan/xylan/chitin deacetylase (PgdA/CDA1 family) [Cohnella lubricantis]